MVMAGRWRTLVRSPVLIALAIVGLLVALRVLNFMFARPCPPGAPGITVGDVVLLTGCPR
jgi:hypothetical protein